MGAFLAKIRAKRLAKVVVILPSFCDLVHIQNVIDPLDKQLQNALHQLFTSSSPALHHFFISSSSVFHQFFISYSSAL